MVRTDGDAEVGVDEGVVDEVGHVLEGLPIVFAARVREQRLEPQTAAWECDLPCSVASRLRYFSPPVEVGLGEVHHEEGHLKRRQHQQHLGGESKDIKAIYSCVCFIYVYFR